MLAVHDDAAPSAGCPNAHSAGATHARSDEIRGGNGGRKGRLHPSRSFNQLLGAAATLVSAKPAELNSRTHSPAGMALKRYSPAVLLRVVSLLVPPRWFAVTRAPGTRAPLGSTTRPARDPRSACAGTG